MRKQISRFLFVIIFVLGFKKRALLEKGSFQKSTFSRDSREFRDSRDSREPPDCGKRRRVRPSSRDSREFRDFRDSRASSREKTPFVMAPFSGPDVWDGKPLQKDEEHLKTPVFSSILVTAFLTPWTNRVAWGGCEFAKKPSGVPQGDRPTGKNRAANAKQNVHYCRLLQGGTSAERSWHELFF